MKRKLFNILLVLLIVFAFASPVFASGLNNPGLPRVVDYGEMFSDSEERLLEEELYKLINKYNYDFLIMTAKDHSTAADDEEFIESVWDYNNFGVGADQSGWVIFVCMDCRQWMHDACGKAVDYLTYDTVNIIDDFMEADMQSGDYYGAMMAAISELDSLFSMGAEKYVESTYSPMVNPPDPTPQHETTVWDKLRNGGISGVIAGIVAGLVSVNGAKRSMKTVTRAETAGGYIEPGSFRMHKREDILLNVHTQRIIKEQAPPPSSHGGGGGGMHHSGGSSYSAPHVSSGGNTHASGGGRHF
ncbi:MAG: TPM domain-containing protein [Firmicutes bacterium]|nr:TPM domain-containing protein [Bacillota bacterium]